MKNKKTTEQKINSNKKIIKREKIIKKTNNKKTKNKIGNEQLKKQINKITLFVGQLFWGKNLGGIF
ncbi:MAG: hypothetical protein GX950_02715 [Candidatus Diapherotrites archaeon]|jgi:hypothetical protein|uniref:Uncharacterized protein n=1 Tax=Candidatus Iainarchaeum sp. TaxID=3101447 RepID=A0A7K4BZQ2_9ARCH|nr:hypothetical protein [Candidatus Diapherotrites archaeon]